MAKLTKRFIDSLKPQQSDYFTWDDELKGFGIRISPKGKKTFLIQYRAAGRTRRMKLGPYGAVTVDEARSRAKTLLGDIAAGENPAEKAIQYRMAPTVAEVCERFKTDHIDVRLKKGTARDYKAMIDKVIEPKLGARKIIDITRTDISDLHHAMKDTPYRANRVLSVISKLFNTAEIWGLRPDGSNPCRHVKKYTEKRRERFLSRNELIKLGEVLETAEKSGTETPYVIAAFRLLILTGCRLSEIRNLKWEYVTDTHLELPDSKTGARMIPLPPQARRILESITREEDNPYVIVGEVSGQQYNDLEKPWRRIRTSAELEDVRIHDLRHTYASNAIMAGLPVPILGKILGHTQIQTTMRYVHLADKSVRDAANKVSKGLGDLITYNPNRKSKRAKAAA
ncbi:MAG: tyrosine-type recombinase/integrase [Rhodospirillaceae bacterium]